MNTIEKIETWGEKHHPKWIDLMRMLLGAIIFYKGYMFMHDTGALQEMMRNSLHSEASNFLVYYVILISLMGGVLIFYGMITRIAVLFQLPILIGALLFVNTQHGIYSVMNDEWWFSALVLFLLVFFPIEGSGPWSMDTVIRNQNHEDDEKFYHNEGHEYL